MKTILKCYLICVNYLPTNNITYGCLKIVKNVLKIAFTNPTPLPPLNVGYTLWGIFLNSREIRETGSIGFVHLERQVKKKFFSENSENLKISFKN